MKNIYVNALVLLSFVLSLFFISFPKFIFAQTNNEYKLEEILSSLDSDTMNIYQKYGDLVDRLTEDENILEIFNEFKISINSWRTLFNSSQIVYQKYINDPDVSISKIASIALESTEIGLQALQKYDRAFSSGDSDNTDYYLEQGDTLIISSSKKHIEAVDEYNLLADKYNDESGVTSAYNTRTYLIVASIFFSLISVFLYFKSRARSSLSTEIMRAGVFQDMFGNSLAMSIGLIITTISYAYALENGSTYYILWGLVLVGGWRFIVGLYNYFTKGRKILKELKEQENLNSTKLSFVKNVDDNYEEEQLESNLSYCPNCGKKITSLKNSKCSSCGYKLNSS